MDLEAVQVQLASTDSDKRIHALQQLQQILAQSPEIPDPDELTALLKTSLRASNAHLSFAALACLPAYFPLLVPSSANSADLTRALSSSTNASSLSPQRPASPSSSVASHPSHSAAQAHVLKHAFASLLPMDKLSDSKEKVRETAREALVSAGRTALRLGVNAGTGGANKEGPWGYLETKMAEQGFHGKSAKAREQALHYLVAIRDPAHTSPLAPLRPFTTLLLPLLGDQDPSVRSLALSSTITIFSAAGVTQPARADLKKAMIKLDVNKKVQETILAAVLGGGSGSMERAGSAASLASGNEKAGAGSDINGSSLSASADPTSPPIARSRPRPPSPASLVASLPSAAFPTDPSAIHAPTTDVQPVYIADLRDLQTEFERMTEGFEGKETEHNWMVRDRSIARIRGMVKGNVQERLLQPFLAGIKSVQDGIAKTASSLRTTVAISALSLISELSNALRHAFDPFLDYFLSHTLGMAGQTKKIVATASQATVTTLITNSAYHHKTLQLLRQGMDEKTTSARGFVSGHVGTFVKVHGRASKSAIEATGGVEEIEQSVKKGLTDPNPLVKENSRTTFWAVREIWPKMAERIAGSLDTSSKKQLDKADPSKKGAVEKAPVAKATRPSVRELMMQAKRQAATGTDPGPPTDQLPETEPPAPSADKSPAPSARPSSLYGKIPTPRSAVSPSTRSISSPSTPTARPRPGLASSTPGSSARRISHTPTLTTPTTSLRQASPAVATPTTPSSPPLAATSSRGGDAPSLTAHDASDESLLKFSSPFGAVDRNGSSLDFSGSAPSSPSSSSQGPRGRIDSLVLPVTESIVDDALRDQAMQAEQAAERLLELAEEEEEAAEAERSATPHGGVEGQMRTPVSKKMQLLREGDVFEDSPDARNGDGAGGAKGKRNWWMKKAENVSVDPPLPPDTLERTQEISSLISSLQFNQIDLAGLKKLSALSKERPVRDEDGGTSSPLASPTYAKNRDEALLPFWEEDRRFSRVWEALSAMLGKEQDQSKNDAALLLFKDLVQNQAPCFAGDESSVFSLLLTLREDSSRTTIAAIEGIADTFVSQCEPLFSLGSLCSSLAIYLAPHDESAPLPEPVVKSFALGLRLLGKFFERLPSEVLEDEVPRRQDLIKRGLNDSHSGDLRRAAVNALVSAQSVLRDEQRLYSMVGGLGRDQLNLLSYYISKLPPV